MNDRLYSFERFIYRCGLFLCLGFAVSLCLGILRDKNGRILRSQKVRHDFMAKTGFPHGRPGWIIDHVIPLCAGGPDDTQNMRWATKEDAAKKDIEEKKLCHAIDYKGNICRLCQTAIIYDLPILKKELCDANVSDGDLIARDCDDFNTVTTDLACRSTTTQAQVLMDCRNFAKEKDGR